MVNRENYEEYILLYVDKELNALEEQALLKFLEQHPERKEELSAYQNTVFTPDEHLVYADKESLIKKDTKVIPWWNGWKTYSAAASLLFAILVIGYSLYKPVDKTQVAQNTNLTQPDNIQKHTDTEPIIEEAPKKLQSQQPISAIAMETKKHTSQSKVDQKIIEEIKHNSEEEVTLIDIPHNNELLAVNTNDIQPEYHALPTIELKIPEAETEKPKAINIQPGINLKASAIDDLGNILSDKLAIAKNVKEKLKDADVTFKFGQKEIFTVRL